MDVRILVPGEADVADLSRLARFDESHVRAFGIEDTVRIVEPDHLVVLDQIDAIGLQAAQRFIELPHRLLFRSTIYLGHQEHLVAVAVAQRLADADLAGSGVVVPRVVEEVDAAIDGAAHDAERQLLVHGRQAKMPAAESDRRYPFFRLAENAVLRGWDRCAL